MSTITVTAGHGGSDPGAVANGVTERDLMTELRDIVSGKLSSFGHKVRTDGMMRANLPLPYALTLIPGSAIAIELHTNASDNELATGVEVISLPGKADLSRKLAKSIASILEIPLRGSAGWIDQAQSARGRLGYVMAGGIIVETFFISNKADLAAYEARKWLVASAIAKVLTEAVA